MVFYVPSHCITFIMESCLLFSLYISVVLINVRRIYVCTWKQECMPMCLQSHLLSFSCHYLATSLPKDNIYSSLVNKRQINFMY